LSVFGFGMVFDSLGELKEILGEILVFLVEIVFGSNF
jgi:hypothetical protein